jgi:hypothetical protein
MEPIIGINSGYSSSSYGSLFNTTDSSSYINNLLKNSTSPSTRGTSSTIKMARDVTTQNVLPALLSTVDDSARALEEALEGARNLTYMQSPRQDRIVPPDLQTKRTMLDPRQATSSLIGAINMPRIQSGTFTINNTVIPVDQETDSFADIIARINSSTAGVYASYNPTEDTLEIASRSPGSKINITEDTSNFLEEANIVLSTYVDSTRSMAFSLPGAPRHASDVLNTMKDFVRGYNKIMEDPTISQDVKSRITENTNELATLRSLQSPASKGFGFSAGGLYFDSSSKESMPIAYDLHNSYAAFKNSPLFLTGFLSGRGGYMEKIRSNISSALSEIAEDGAGENINVSV